MPSSPHRRRGITRREFEKRALAASLGAAFDFPGVAAQSANGRVPTHEQLQPVASLPERVTRTWIGPGFWANRLQDWRLHDGRIQCLMGRQEDLLRTVGCLTREMIAGNEPAHISARIGLFEAAGGRGFGGFLVGAGGGALDYRAAAVVQKASGAGGGLLCVFGTDGRARFRDHTSEQQPLVFAQVPAREERVEDPREAVGALTDGLPIRLDILPDERGTFTLALTVGPPEDVVARTVREGVAESELLGGISLVSSPEPGEAGTMFWFNDVRMGGRKIAVHPERTLGPILGTLYSLNRNVLKLAAQLMPVGDSEPQTVRLEIRQTGGPWREAATARVEPGYTAHFRVENWDSTRDAEYRVLYDGSTCDGTIRRDPRDRSSVSIALFSCTIASARNLEGGRGEPELPQAELLGRYTPKNIYFPHAEVVRHASHHTPDLLVFAGDQLYEGNPTRRDDSLTPTLDYLYKWYLWLWSFREMTRSTPAVVLVDDHDVYHGNVWGNGGRAAPEQNQNRGGYRCTGEFVNLVQRTQCGHNPDAFDPAPVDQSIGVYYGAFEFGGVSFAIIEDRKFKTAPLQGTDLDVHEPELLGERQERFLAAWAKMPDGGGPRICLTQTLFGCLQTSPQGRPLVDFDSNGYPKLPRDRAIRLLRDAHALVLAGDQHLASVVRHGIDTFEDGVLQFSGPAVATSWQRWFEPAEPLPNARGNATGDFVDAFGNKLRVLATANPKVTFKDYRAHRKGRPQGLGDRRLKREGYAIVRVNRSAREIVLECWPWNADPGAAGATQFDGWPIRVGFDEL